MSVTVTGYTHGQRATVNVGVREDSTQDPACNSDLEGWVGVARKKEMGRAGVSKACPGEAQVRFQ